jgi:hypothetical protein
MVGDRYANPILVTKHFDNEALQLVPRRIHFPPGTIQQPLRLVWPIVTNRLRQLPAVLACDRPQQPAHLLGRLLLRFAASKKVGKSGMKAPSLQPSFPIPRVSLAYLLSKQNPQLPTRGTKRYLTTDIL